MQLEKNNSEFILYQTDDGLTKIQVRLENETVWLTQADMVALFQSSKANISEHIKHIFEEGELNENSVCRNFRHTADDGKTYDTKFYNLDVIISVGYRVKPLSIKLTKITRMNCERTAFTIQFVSAAMTQLQNIDNYIAL